MMTEKEMSEMMQDVVRILHDGVKSTGEEDVIKTFYSCVMFNESALILLEVSRSSMLKFVRVDDHALDEAERSLRHAIRESLSAGAVFTEK